MGLVILTLLGLKYLPAWVKLVWLFHRLIKQTMCLKYYEIEAGNATNNISKHGDSVESYAPLCPLPIIIALSFHLDSVEAGMFRKYLCQRLQSPAPTFIPIIVDTSGVQGC